MLYFISFIEGLSTFGSLCLLPLIIVYVLYLLGQKSDLTLIDAIINSIVFILAFMFVFILVGAFGSALGESLQKTSMVRNLLIGFIMLIFAGAYMRKKTPYFLKPFRKLKDKTISFISTGLFGIIFSIEWVYCIGLNLDSALMLYTRSADKLEFIFLLFLFSLGIGFIFIPLSVLINGLKKSIINFTNRYSYALNILFGAVLFVIGILTMLGYTEQFLKMHI